MLKAHIVALSILISIISHGCGIDVYRVAILFPNQEDLGRTQFLKIFAIIPGPNASCESLREGNAKPDDDGYEIEDAYEINMFESEAPRPLRDIGPGKRLFYAEAWDEHSQEQPFLRGCTLAVAGEEGLREVIIELLHGGIDG